MAHNPAPPSPTLSSKEQGLQEANARSNLGAYTACNYNNKKTKFHDLLTNSDLQ